MGKLVALVYGLLCWFGFLGLFLYLIGFLGNFIVPKTVNSGVEGPVVAAILINLFLIALFGIHHTVTARPGFKEWITRYTPKHLERSTYVLISNLLFGMILWQWRPIPTVVWQVENPTAQMVLYGLFGLGWTLVVFSSFLINHFDLFGVRQVWLNFVGKKYTPVPFKLKSLYKHMRNPIMTGWFIAFWATPLMTVGHLVFAAGLTLYGLIGIFFEERTHLQYFGKEYKAYQDKTPMLFPVPKKA